MEFKKKNNPEFNNPSLYPIKLMPINQQFYTPQINKISFEMPDVPLLSQFEDVPKNMICSEDNMKTVCPANSTEFCTCLHLIEVNYGDLVEFIFVDETLTQFEIPVETIHPIHMHGHTFAVVSMDTPETIEPITVDYIKKLDEKGQIERNFEQPPIKDTVIVPDGGYTVFRFVAHNPGVWMVHCHLDFHMVTGMSFVVKVGDVTRPPKNWPKCGSFSIEKEISDVNSAKCHKSSFSFVFCVLLQGFFIKKF